MGYLILEKLAWLHNPFISWFTIFTCRYVVLYSDMAGLRIPLFLSHYVLITSEIYFAQVSSLETNS